MARVPAQPLWTGLALIMAHCFDGGYGSGRCISRSQASGRSGGRFLRHVEQEGGNCDVQNKFERVNQGLEALKSCGQYAPTCVRLLSRYCVGRSGDRKGLDSEKMHVMWEQGKRRLAWRNGRLQEELFASQGEDDMSCRQDIEPYTVMVGKRLTLRGGNAGIGQWDEVDPSRRMDDDEAVTKKMNQVFEGRQEEEIADSTKKSLDEIRRLARDGNIHIDVGGCSVPLFGVVSSICLFAYALRPSR